jgi:predicted aspartyl protease
LIAGSVDEEGIPSIQLDVAGRTWKALIDTGFKGDLELPEDLRTPLNARPHDHIVSLLAGGRLIEEDSYLVDFPFDGQALIAEATFAPLGTILIGTNLLRRHRLEIDFVARTVRLERVA